MDEDNAIGALKTAIGVAMVWMAVDTAALDTAVAWPKWVLVPVLLAYGFGFFASALGSA